MSTLILKYKLLSMTAKAPYRATEEAACYDVYADTAEYRDDYIEYNTNVAYEVPPGYVMNIYPRSSISSQGLILCNSVGKLDSDYRGPLKIRFYRFLKGYYSPGDRIAQIELIPVVPIELQEVQTLTDTKRGTGSFGSTGSK